MDGGVKKEWKIEKAWRFVHWLMTTLMVLIVWKTKIPLTKVFRSGLNKNRIGEAFAKNVGFGITKKKRFFN
jgi:hypothetical protein